MTHTDWKSITAEELRIAAKVVRTAGGEVIHAAADAWEARAIELEGATHEHAILVGNGFYHLFVGDLHLINSKYNGVASGWIVHSGGAADSDGPLKVYK